MVLCLLHGYTTLFGQLDGFGGVQHLNRTYRVSLLAGTFTLAVLTVMAATSFDWVVDRMGYKHWKLLHRLVYLASAALLLHVLLIGPHYDRFSAAGLLTWLAAAFLVALEAARIRLNVQNRRTRARA